VGPAVLVIAAASVLMGTASAQDLVRPGPEGAWGEPSQRPSAPGPALKVETGPNGTRMLVLAAQAPPPTASTVATNLEVALGPNGAAMRVLPGDPSASAVVPASGPSERPPEVIEGAPGPQGQRVLVLGGQVPGVTTGTSTNGLPVMVIDIVEGQPLPTPAPGVLVRYRLVR